FGVAGARHRAELCGHLIYLRQRHQESLRARRASNEDQQQAGREGIERSSVTDLDPAAEAPAHVEHDVMGCDPGGFVIQGDPAGVASVTWPNIGAVIATQERKCEAGSEA